MRPHSEAKTWAPSSVPSAPQSAPPELAAQHKSQHSQHSGYKSPESESVSLGSFSGINGHKDLDSERDSPLPTNIQDTSAKTEKITDIVEETKERQSPEPSVKSAAGTNLKYLEDPTSETEKKKDSSLPTSITKMLVTTSSSTSHAPQQSYRILEAESSPQDTGNGGTTSTGSSTMGGYHVLEAPAIVPDSTQRSAASDVLEKARNRFDKFWGKVQQRIPRFSSQRDKMALPGKELDFTSLSVGLSTVGTFIASNYLRSEIVVRKQRGEEMSRDDVPVKELSSLIADDRSRSS
ncbi:mediator of dna damage checkpoint protein 1 isoform x21 [Lasius niger]|uniref:Mediator of dna damage checkpoint protein 1 isoform x21 n=1 Tax=Lasius niger TaxID=67767 RepID=A0A0J7KR92_LASNI|nr:mediator of dna damage checkpoint protein 1 isoform x21 [Lasius niger]